MQAYITINKTDVYQDNPQDVAEESKQEQENRKGLLAWLGAFLSLAKVGQKKKSDNHFYSRLYRWKYAII